jgi:GTP cyclohydrolase I
MDTVGRLHDTAADYSNDANEAVRHVHEIAAKFAMNETPEKPPSFELALTKAFQELFGNEVWDDSAAHTARRVIRFWREFEPQQDFDFTFTTFPATANQLIVVRDIEFSSLCAHHLLPYYGKAHVGYIPNKLMVGLSKIPRLVDFWARRPSVQESLTANVASDLKHRLGAMGVAVVIEARHTCMACRGVRKHNGAMVTSEMRGIFLTAGEARREFLELIGRTTI